MATNKDHSLLLQAESTREIPHPILKMKQKRPQIKPVSSTSSTPRNLSTVVPMPTKPNLPPNNTPSSSSSSSLALTPPLSSATRIISSMKKSFVVSAPKKRQTNAVASSSGMYSTPTERAPTSRNRSHSTSGAPPTIEQIAMGLHTSRTPHLRPHRSHSQSHGTPYKTHPTLPPAPARSSMKKPRTTTADLAFPPITHEVALAQIQSTASLSSATASSLSSRPFGFKARMGRLLSRASSSTAPSSSLHTPLSSPGESLVSLPPRKAVRFSQSVLNLSDS